LGRATRNTIVGLGIVLGAPLMTVSAVSAAESASKVAQIANADAEVFMKVRATRAQVDAMENKVARSRLVKSFAYLSKEDAFDEFSKIFADDAKTRGGITPDDLPESFRVRLRHQIDAATFVATFRRSAGVPDVPSRVIDLMWEQCIDSPADMEVDMRTRATTTQAAHVEQWLRANASVASVHRFSARNAFNTWHCLAGQQGPRRSLDEFPVSFRVDLHADTNVRSLQEQVAQLPGVAAPPGRPHYL
jgi:cell division protein FtsX